MSSPPRCRTNVELAGGHVALRHCRYEVSGSAWLEHLSHRLALRVEDVLVLTLLYRSRAKDMHNTKIYRANDITYLDHLFFTLWLSWVRIKLKFVHNNGLKSPSNKAEEIPASKNKIHSTYFKTSELYIFTWDVEMCKLCF